MEEESVPVIADLIVSEIFIPDMSAQVRVASLDNRCLLRVILEFQETW